MKLKEQKEEELEACEAMQGDDVFMRANVMSTHDNMNTAQAALNVHTLCRICAEAGEHMEEIFGAAQLHTKIHLCLPIKVCESDSLPLIVCHSCVAGLENSFDLATQSQRSDVILRDLQQQQNEEQKYQPRDPLEHRVAVSQISAVNSPVSNMDLSQTSRHNSPPNSSTVSECENNAVKKYNLKPLSVQLTRLSQSIIDTCTVKVEQDVSESSQEQMINDDTNLQNIKLEPQFININETDFIEENHRAAGCDVRIMTEADESCSNLYHIPNDNEILQDEDPLQNEITSELIIKPENELSDVEESRDNVHDISDDTEHQTEGEIGRQVDIGLLDCTAVQVTLYPCHQNNDKGPLECEHNSILSPSQFEPGVLISAAEALKNFETQVCSDVEIAIIDGNSSPKVTQHNKKKSKKKLYNIDSSEEDESDIECASMEESLKQNELSTFEAWVRSFDDVEEESTQDTDAANQTVSGSSKYIQDYKYPSVTFLTTNNGNVKSKTNRRFNKYFCCAFCGKFKTNFSRHMKKFHAREGDVKEYSKIDVSSENDPSVLRENKKKRFILMEALRNRGNALNNTKVQSMKEGTMIVKYRPTPGSACTLDSFLMCIHCLGYYKADNLCAHMRKCHHVKRVEGTHKVNRQARSKAILLRDSLEQINENLRKNVLIGMKVDHIFKIIIRDPLILKFAPYRLSELEKHSKHIQYLRNELRELGRLMHYIREKTKDTSNPICYLQELLRKDYYETYIKPAILEIATKDIAVKNLNLKPQLVFKLGHNLFHVASFLLIEDRKKTIQDTVYRANLIDLVELLREDYFSQVANAARDSSNTKTGDDVEEVDKAVVDDGREKIERDNFEKLPALAPPYSSSSMSSEGNLNTASSLHSPSEAGPPPSTSLSMSSEDNLNTASSLHSPSEAGPPPSTSSSVSSEGNLNTASSLHSPSEAGPPPSTSLSMSSEDNLNTASSLHSPSEAGPPPCTSSSVSSEGNLNTASSLHSPSEAGPPPSTSLSMSSEDNLNTASSLHSPSEAGPPPCTSSSVSSAGNLNTASSLISPSEALNPPCASSSVSSEGNLNTEKSLFIPSEVGFPPSTSSSVSSEGNLNASRSLISPSEVGPPPSTSLSVSSEGNLNASRSLISPSEEAALTLLCASLSMSSEGNLNTARSLHSPLEVGHPPCANLSMSSEGNLNTESSLCSSSISKNLGKGSIASIYDDEENEIMESNNETGKVVTEKTLEMCAAQTPEQRSGAVVASVTETSTDTHNALKTGTVVTEETLETCAAQTPEQRSGAVVATATETSTDTHNALKRPAVTSVKNGKTKRRCFTRISWTEEQRSAMLYEFRIFFITDTLPQKKDCLRAMENQQVLKDRFSTTENPDAWKGEWKRIKDYVKYLRDKQNSEKQKSTDKILA